MVQGSVGEDRTTAELQARVASLEALLADAVLREERLVTALDRTEHVYWLGSVRDGAITYSHASPAYGRLFGVPPEALYADPYAWLSAVHPDDRRRVEARVRAAPAQGEVRQLEFRLARPDGEVRWLQSRVVLLEPENGDPGVLVGVAVDVTEARRTQDALARSTLLLAEAEQRALRDERLRALGQLASGIAHDFNNHLTPILGFCDLLLDGPPEHTDPARSRRYLEAMRTAAQGASGVVARLREFYRARERDEPRTLVDVSQVMREAMALAEPRWRDLACLRGQPVTLTDDLRAGRRIQASAHELRDALLNLILNAVDALGPRGGTIALRTRDEGEEVVLEVQDDGCGMSLAVRERCFEPFFTTKADGGTGLGLPQVWGVVERHGGVVDLDTAPGRGTRITLRLPVTPRGAPDPTSGPHGKPTRSLRVLLVDDQDPSRDVLREVLAVDGHDVLTAATGDDALAHLRRGDVDVLITDRSMPGLNGDGLARQARALAPDLPILMLTGFGAFMDDEDRPADVDRVLAKPISLARLRKALRRAVP